MLTQLGRCKCANAQSWHRAKTDTYCGHLNLISRKKPTRCGRAPPPDDRTPHTTATTGPGHPTPRSGGISCHGLTHPAASHHVPAASRPAVNWPLDQAPPVRGHLLRPRASHAPRRRDALLLPDTAAPERRTHHSRPQARAAICGTTLRDHVPPNDDKRPTSRADPPPCRPRGQHISLPEEARRQHARAGPGLGRQRDSAAAGVMARSWSHGAQAAQRRRGSSAESSSAAIMTRQQRRDGGRPGPQAHRAASRVASGHHQQVGAEATRRAAGAAATRRAA